MKFHHVLTFLFLILPLLLLFFKKFYLVKKKIIRVDSKFSLYYEYITMGMVLLYNIYFLFYYFNK
jgi:hypothetical protein